jgi:hypothetical protein
MFSLFLLPFFVLAPDSPAERAVVIVAVGAPGEDEFAGPFRQAAEAWKAAAATGHAECYMIGLDQSGTTDRDRLQAALAATPREGREPLWVVLIGHGTFDGRAAKFNLRGPDVSDVELSGWLAPIKRPVVVINGASSSGPFLNRLSGSDRVVVTATRSGHESNYARFGQYLAEAIADPRADLDKDGQVSLLEAFLTAGARVDEFYKSRSRLATEHPLLDDNGDGLGTPPDWFRGVRAVKRARDGAAADGVRAHQLHLVLSDRERLLPAEVRQTRDRIERTVAELRDRKSRLAEDDYYARLETLMVELARIYQTVPR